MNITLTQSDLNEAIQIVQKAVSSRSILPVLTGVLFKAENGFLDLYATDLELSIRSAVSATIVQEGSAVIPARLLGEIVKNLPDARIEIVVDDKNGTVRLAGSSSVFELRSYAPADFPKFPTIAKESATVVNGKVFSDVVRHVIKAVSRDETRPVLSGALMTTEKGRLRMVATDSYRLSIKEAAVEGVGANPQSAIIPGRSLDEVARICGDRDIEIGLAANQAYFNLGETVVVSRLIEGQFPNYQQLLPSDCELRVKFVRNELIATLKRVALLAQTNSLVKMKVSGGDVEVSAMAQDVGSAIERLAAQVDGEGMEVAFNANYLLDGLQSISEDEVLLELNSPLKPGLLKPVEKQDFIYLVMPVRIG